MWLFRHDTETKARSSQRVKESPPQTKTNMSELIKSESDGDSLFFFCFIHHEFVPRGQTV